MISLVSYTETSSEEEENISDKTIPDRCTKAYSNKPGFRSKSSENKKEVDDDGARDKNSSPVRSPEIYESTVSCRSCPVHSRSSDRGKMNQENGETEHKHHKPNDHVTQGAYNENSVKHSTNSCEGNRRSRSRSTDNEDENDNSGSCKDNKFTETVPRSAPTSEWQTNVHRKRKLSSERDENNQLKVPDSVKFMFQHRQQRWVDNPSEHGNRLRSFPHVEGNWATHVFVQVDRDERFERFVNELMEKMRPLPFEAFPEFHVSLSRTVTIRHHWIEPLVESLRQNLRLLNSCISDLMAVKLYTNDEKTRTFLCLELSEDDTEFLNYVKAVDKSFSEFKLPAYYENPSFHISIGWCLGDVTGKVPEDKISKAKEMLSNFIATNPDLSILYIRQICCRSGNKSFVLTLQDS